MASALICYVCEKEFSKTANLNRHLREVHDEVTTMKRPRQNFKCVICNEYCEDYKHFTTHVFENHNVEIKKERIQFTNTEEFYMWKNDVEDKENSFFSKQRTTQPPNKPLTVYFGCNRSGLYKPKITKRKRKLKAQGTAKILGYCPAGIKAVFKDDGPVCVEYRSTHVGHSSDLAHLKLRLEQRLNIAEKIANKIPFDDILDEIRSSTKGHEIKREHLITKQDLYNIEKEFSLDKYYHHSSDAVSIAAWVEKERASENNSILVYKPKGDISEEYQLLGEEDFILGIMTSAQADILSKYSSDCVCVDFTLGEDACELEMTTLIVLDEMRQGFPCAIFISNRTDKESIEIFFNAVKNQVGTISSNIFMSDVSDVFYNAWESVMVTPDNRLFCSWHVDRAWRDNLSKIKDLDEQENTFKKLTALLEETDQDAFLEMLSSFTQDLYENEITNEFGEYFWTYFGSCYQLWAKSFRISLGIDTNLHLETMHRTIEQLYLKGKTEERLDKAVHAIMQMIKSTVFDRLIVLEKGKITSKLKNLQTRHRLSLKMKSEVVFSKGDGCWEVVSSSKKYEVYTVRQVNDYCECSLICKDCSACIHKYSCTCIDSAIKWNMCKHIHLICRFTNVDLPAGDYGYSLSAKEETANDSDERETLMMEEDLDREKTILQEVGPYVESGSIDEQILLLLAKFESILDTVSTPEEVHVINDTIDSLVPRLSAVKRYTFDNTGFKIKSNTSSNKNIQSQMCSRTTVKEENETSNGSIDEDYL